MTDLPIAVAAQRRSNEEPNARKRWLKPLNRLAGRATLHQMFHIRRILERGLRDENSLAQSKKRGLLAQTDEATGA
jgi:inactivated superfamily I helicase